MQSLTIPQLRKQAEPHIKHARNCKKPLDACTLCKASVAWYATLAGPVLSQVLEDRGTPVRG
jgi:hypothetical protein